MRETAGIRHGENTIRETGQSKTRDVETDPHTHFAVESYLKRRQQTDGEKGKIRD